MSMIDRSLDGMAFLSGQLGAMLRRRLREIGGIALLSLAMMAALALATWSVHDPSLSHATDAPRAQSARPARRDRRRSDDAIARLGLAGAAAAGRRVGLSAARASAARPRTVARSALGVRRRARRRLCRLSAARSAWPLPCGLGGVVGDAMLRAPAMLFGTPIAWTVSASSLAVVLGMAALVTFAGAAGFIWRGSADEDDAIEEEEDEDEAEEEDDDAAWVSLGRLIAYRIELPHPPCADVPRPRAHGGAGAQRGRRAAAPGAAFRRPAGSAHRRRSPRTK